MPIPPTSNLVHYRGDSLVLRLALWTDAEKTQPADLSTASICAQVRETPDSTEVAATFDVTVEDNIVTANLSPKSSRDLPAKGTWDIEVDWYSDDSFVQTVAGGGLVTKPDTSRDCV